MKTQVVEVAREQDWTAEALRLAAEDIEADELKREDWPGRWFVTVVADKSSRGFRDVRYALFRVDMPEDEVKSLLASCGYTEQDSDSNPYLGSQVEETFSWEEVERLREYFSQWNNTHLEVRPASKPHPRGIGTPAIPVGGGTDFYMFCEEDDYSLDFDIYGYFDVRDTCPRCKLALHGLFCHKCGWSAGPF